MKKLLLLILFPLVLSAQFTDYFNDFSTWYGDTNYFVVDSINRLQLIAPQQSGNVFIWHSSSALLKGQWQLDVFMDFNPSSSNYANIHLSSDSLGNWRLEAKFFKIVPTLCKDNVLTIAI